MTRIKRYVVLLFALVLVLSAIPVAVEAADGAISPDSIGESYSNKFRETTTDDTLFFPDAYENDTIDLADDGELGVGSGSHADYVKTHVVDGDGFGSLVSEPVLWFTFASTVDLEGFSYGCYAEDGTASSATDLKVYNHTGSTWVDIGDIDDAYSWENGTLYNPDYWNSTHIGLHVDVVSGGSMSTDTWDYCEITIIQMLLADSDHYGESSADVSDWDQESFEEMGSDGDVAYWDLKNDGNYDYTYTNALSLPAGNYSYEFRVRDNHTFGSNYGSYYIYSGDDHTGDSQTILSNYYVSGSFTVVKGYFTAAWTIECLRFRHKDATNPTRLYFDYFRIALDTETGYQHDCSTITGTDASSSDGDKINVTSSITFDIDTTVTAALSESSYYPFLELNVADGSGTLTAEIHDGSSWSTIQSATSVSAGSYYWNVFVNSDVKQIRYNASSWFTADYTQLFSIANWDYMDIGTPSTTCYNYVESGLLYGVGGTSSDYIYFRNYFELAVNTATHNILNVTSSDYTNVGCRLYVDASWSSWDDGITRKELASGTLTLLDIRFRGSTGNIIAIEFWTDATDPVIESVFVNPDDCYDDESVSFTCHVTESVSIYEININAVTYPTGFSDTDYLMTADTDDLLYSYTFSTLTAGYYLFALIADDGQGTDTEYLPLRVRESEITIDPISYVGPGDDFEDVTFSFMCNKDGTYSITEWTETDGSDASETNTGSVIDGMNAISWDKLDAPGDTVYFNFTVTNGTLTTVWKSEYQVSRSTFYWEHAEPANGYDTFTLTAYISKDAAYIVYDQNETIIETGSISQGDFEIDFAKWAVGDELEHDFSIRFANGSQTCWYNSTFFNFAKEKGGGGYVPAWWGSAFYWNIFAMIIGVMIILVAIGVKGGNFKNV